MTTKNPERRWAFGSIIVYAPDRFRAREAYELILERGTLEAFGTVTLKDGTQIQWVDINRKSNG